MKKTYSVNGPIAGLCVLSLLVLPGCSTLEFIKSKMNASSASKTESPVASKKVDDDSTVLLSINGKPVMTEKSFDKRYQQFLSTNPQMQQMIQFMPNAKKEIFSGMANEQILIEWGEQNHIHKSNSYQQELEQAVRLVKTNLAAKQFEKDVIGTITVTDTEIKDYYDAHKNPELIVSPGGIKVEGKSFDSKEKAQDFFNKIKDEPKKFKAEAGKDIKEFAPVNKMSFDIEAPLKDKVLALTDFPKALMVEADKKYWVVVALKKEEAQYRSLGEVKEAIEGMIKREKTMKIYTEKLAQLKKEYNVVENLAPLEQAAPAGMPMMPQHEEPEAAQKKIGGPKAL